jgi:hypothetical protein
MNWKCKNIQKDIVAYLDKELSEKRARSISRHLETCSICGKELKGIEESMKLLLVWEDISPSENYDNVFWQKVTSVSDQYVEKKTFLAMLRLYLSQNLKTVTSTALVVLLVLMTFFQSRPQRDLDLPQVYMATNMELFLNLEIIENSEALEHFELIEVLDQLEKDL